MKKEACSSCFFFPDILQALPYVQSNSFRFREFFHLFGIFFDMLLIAKPRREFLYFFRLSHKVCAQKLCELAVQTNCSMYLLLDVAAPRLCNHVQSWNMSWSGHASGAVGLACWCVTRLLILYASALVCSCRSGQRCLHLLMIVITLGGCGYSLPSQETKKSKCCVRAPAPLCCVFWHF